MYKIDDVIGYMFLFDGFVECGLIVNVVLCCVGWYFK